VRLFKNNLKFKLLNLIKKELNLIIKMSNFYKNRRERALYQRMYLLDAKILNTDNWEFQVKGSTGNKYKIVLNTHKMSCSCSDFKIRHRICKHLFFIIVRIAKDKDTFDILGTCPDIDIFGLNPSLSRLLTERLMRRVAEEPKKIVKIEEGSRMDETCSICFEDIDLDKSIDKCNACKHLFHVGCIIMWLKYKKNCPLCRKMWYIESEGIDELKDFSNLKI
jgi:hypothetical protein